MPTPAVRILTELQHRLADILTANPLPTQPVTRAIREAEAVHDAHPDDDNPEDPEADPLCRTCGETVPCPPVRIAHGIPLHPCSSCSEADNDGQDPWTLANPHPQCAQALRPRATPDHPKLTAPQNARAARWIELLAQTAQDDQKLIARHTDPEDPQAREAARLRLRLTALEHQQAVDNCIETQVTQELWARLDAVRDYARHGGLPQTVTATLLALLDARPAEPPRQQTSAEQALAAHMATPTTKP